MVDNAYVRLCKLSSIDGPEEEVLRYDLGEDFSIETAVVFAELYKHNGQWKFAAVGSGYEGGLAALGRAYGLDVEEEQ
jgi:tellurium resistance protein TerD